MELKKTLVLQNVESMVMNHVSGADVEESTETLTSITSPSETDPMAVIDDLLCSSAGASLGYHFPHQYTGLKVKALCLMVSLYTVPQICLTG